MDTALITGASRGLGLALARALARRGWRLVIDARGADALEAARAELAELTEVVAIAGDVADTEHRAGARRGRRRRASTCSSTTPACSARARSRRSPTTRWTSSSTCYRVNVVAPLALVQLALPRLRPGAGVVNVTSDAAVEPYEGWGGYGSSKAALEQLTRDPRAPSIRSCAIYAVDPGDMRTQMHQDAFPGEDISDRPPPEASVPGAARADRGRRCPSGRYRREIAAGRRHERGARASSCPQRAARRTSRPRRAAARDEVRLLVAARATAASRTRASPTCPTLLEPGDLLVVNTSATLPAALAARRRDGGGCTSRRLCRPRPRRRRRALGRRAARRRRRRTARGRAGERLRCPAGGEARAARAVRWAGSGCGSPRLRCPSRCSRTSPATAQPIRYGYVPERVAAGRLPDRLRARARAAPRCRAPGRPFTARARHALVARGVRGRADRAAHRRLLARARRGALPRALRGAGRDRRGSSTPSALGRPRDRRRHDGRAGARDRRRPDGTVHAGEGWTRLVITPERGAARGRRPAHRLARARGVAPADARGGRRPRARSSARTTRRSPRGYLWHEFGDSHLLLP